MLGKSDTKKRPGTPNDSPKEANADQDQKSPEVLRKRNTLSPRNSGLPNGAPGTLKAGESVLDQIGRPDHAGWLRKKGEHYNTWKLRYLVLKGSDLYFLRGNTRTVSRAKLTVGLQC